MEDNEPPETAAGLVFAISAALTAGLSSCSTTRAGEIASYGFLAIAIVSALALIWATAIRRRN